MALFKRRSITPQSPFSRPKNASGILTRRTSPLHFPSLPRGLSKGDLLAYVVLFVGSFLLGYMLIHAFLELVNGR